MPLFDGGDYDNQLINFNISSNEYIFSSNELPSEITIDDIKIFHKTHDDYSTKLYQAFLKFQYDFIEKLIQQFWSLTNINDLTNNGIVNNK
jgi:hypothetical protein